MYRWLWPGCEDWIGCLSESKDERFGKDAKRWKFHRPQEKGQYFILDISKHKGKGRGKARLIKRILFLQGSSYQWDCPSEYKMIIEGGNHILKEFNGKAGKPWKGEDYKGIDETFDPLLVNLIIVSITEPRLPTDHPRADCWATNDIRIIEVRLPWLPKWHWLLPLREKEID